MIKLIIFDLDGVMIDSCDIHYITLNKAIKEIAGDEFCITNHEHEHVYNGRSTLNKLQLMVELKGLDENIIDSINAKKQDLTASAMAEQVTYNTQKVNLLRELKRVGYNLSCCSNCTRRTVDQVLSKLGVLHLFDLTFCNEDVIFSKPSPLIYQKAMFSFGVEPHETLIIEDSFIGLRAARNSGAFVCKVANSTEVTLEKVYSAIEYYSQTTTLKKTMYDKQITVVIPMSGNGSRFSNVGYKEPKPLIPVFGVPMISQVVDNIGIDAKFIYIVKSEHLDKYNLEEQLRNKTPDCEIIQVHETTEGAACTVLLAREFINTSNPLLIINCDQWLEWNCEDFVFDFIENKKDALVKVSTFISDGSKKWSYVAVDDKDNVIDVQEKNPISIFGTTGAYLWRHGRDFVRCAEAMIAKNIRVNNEFYVAPVINEIIGEGGKVIKEECDKFWSLGVPEDLEFFVKNFIL